MSASGVSTRTWVVLALGVLLVAGAAIAITLPVTGEFADKVISDIVETGLGLASFGFIMWATTRFGKGEPVRLHWTLIGIGVLLFALGDLVWTYYEIILRVEPPYPGLPDVFYLLQYPFLGTGVGLAALAYRRLMDIRGPVVLAAVATVVPGVVVWFALLQHIVGDDSVSLLEKATSAFYPIGDLLLLLFPVLVIVFVVLRLKGGRLGWPWWAVALGLVLWAFSDTMYSYLDWVETYQSGMAIDYGWMAGLALMAVGASLAVDVLGRRRPR